MDARPPYDPYAAGALHPVGPPPTPDLLARRIAGYSFLVSTAASALVGAAFALQFAYGLQSFGGVEYVPRVIALTAARSHAASIDLVVTSLTAVSLAHRASRAVRPVALDRSGARWVGATVAILAPVDGVCFLLGAFIMLRAIRDMPARTMLEPFSVAPFWSDLAFGALVTAAFTLFATLVLPSLVRRVVAWPRGLLLKLVVVWAIVQAFGYAVRFGLSAAFVVIAP